MLSTGLEQIQGNIGRINARIQALESLSGSEQFAASLDAAEKLPKNIQNTFSRALSNSPTPGMGPGKEEIKKMVIGSAQKNGVDPALALALVQMESGFNPNAVSKVGAMGLTQLMPGTAAGLGVDEPFNAEKNLDGGMRYLKSMIGRFGGKTELALAAYNAGPGAVNKYKGIPPYKETQHYVKTIQNLYQKYQNQLAD
ncbi:MAG: lytic transglycosylase domain-containing protein [Vampirovibrionales bacterium]|nr:lytic transglycosylase domain-containing protein [Vampirovibrionales bacterium]